MQHVQRLNNTISFRCMNNFYSVYNIEDHFYVCKLQYSSIKSVVFNLLFKINSNV